MADILIDTRDLAVGYGGRPLISHIALQIRRGRIMTLIGPNGAGKSTILKSIIRQLKPVCGAVYLEGRDMARVTDAEAARRMSVVMTERIRPELMRCEDVAAMGRYPYTGRLGILTEEDRRKVREAMELVHAQDLADRDFTEISDGQRQRVLLARALCQEPEVIVLDEPTSFLDIRHKLELLAILKDLVRRKNLAVVMSLHELDLAQKISDQVVCVEDGAIGRCGPPEEIFSGSYIMELFGAARGSFNPSFGSLELERVTGEPEVFVIGGGGSGIGVYRSLQRRGIPFAAGVLQENDLDLPVARALAVTVVTEQAYEPIGERAYAAAAALVDRCPRVICCTERFGPMNQGNRRLAEYAQSKGKLTMESPVRRAGS